MWLLLVSVLWAAPATSTMSIEKQFEKKICTNLSCLDKVEWCEKKKRPSKYCADNVSPPKMTPVYDPGLGNPLGSVEEKPIEK